MGKGFLERRWGSGEGSPRHLWLIYIDDAPPMAWSQGWYGQFAPQYPGNTATSQLLYPQTPWINGRASSGLTFENAINAPVCSPGRAGIQTGVYQPFHGLLSIVRDDRSGTTAEFGDEFTAQYDLLADKLDTAATTVTKGWAGKMHLSLYGGDGGVEYEIIDKAAGESGNGKLGDWEYRAVLLNNPNNAPVPAPGTAGDQSAGANESADGSDGSYYFYRVRVNRQERNIGNIVSPSGETATSNNSDGQYNTSWIADRCIDFWTLLPDGNRGFLYTALNATHAPFDEPPHGLLTTSEYLSPVNVWRRQLAMMESVDRELERIWNAMPASVRRDTAVIICCDNGIDGPWVDAAFDDEGLDLGRNWVRLKDDADATTTSRFKSSVYQYGVNVQLLASGPGWVKGQHSTALVNAHTDLYGTILEYFGVTNTGAHSVPLTPLLAGTATGLADHTRKTSYTCHAYPNGSRGDAVFDNAVQWASGTDYAIGNDVSHNSNLYEALLASGPGNGGAVEPGTDKTVWEQHRRDECWYEYLTATTDGGSIAAPFGLFKLIRRPGNNANTDTLYHIRALDGSSVDRWEHTALDTAGAYSTHLTYMAGELDTFISGAP